MSRAFIAIPKTGEVIFGINSNRTKGEVEEVVYQKAAEQTEAKLKCTYTEIDSSNETTIPVILAKPGWAWGATSGANAKGVAAGVIWQNGYGGFNVDDSSSNLVPIDFVRLCLERSESSERAIDVISKLLETYGPDNSSSQASYFISDCNQAWLLNTAGKLWAAQLLSSGLSKITSGLSIKQIDKCDEGNQDKLSEFWPSDGSALLTEDIENSFSLTDMFSVLRDKQKEAFIGQENDPATQNSHVSTLSQDALCCHWFTATPDPSISVFKPFIFTPNAVVSPLTVCKKQDDGSFMHGLYKLHSVGALGKSLEMLKDMETCCVQEVQQFIASDSNINPELDELMKDCVEAEVKFYR